MRIKIEVNSDEQSDREHAEEGLEQLLGLLASNPKTPRAVLSALSKKESPRLLCQVASNPQAELATLDDLAQDPHESVRACVADHPKATCLMWKLVKDPSPLVRYILASNRDLPEHIFSVLAKDENFRVARRAKRTLKEIQSQDSIVNRFFSVFATARRAS